MYIPSAFTEAFISFSITAFICLCFFLIRFPGALLSYMFWPFDKGKEAIFAAPAIWLFFLAALNLIVGIITDVF